MSTVWQYAFFHNDLKGMKEYITEHTNVSGITIPYMKTSLLSIDKITLHEFDSLVNPRTHLMKGDNSNILNQ